MRPLARSGLENARCVFAAVIHQVPSTLYQVYGIVNTLIRSYVLLSVAFGYPVQIRALWAALLVCTVIFR